MNSVTLKCKSPGELREYILQQAKDMSTLQPFSKTTLDLVNACNDPQSDVGRLVSIIESDPAITARVLAVANSPLYGYSREIGSIQHALVILGKRTITRLALSFGTNQGFCNGGGEKVYRRRLYEHSLACGLIARALTQVERRTDPEMAFLGGVLHDIGKLVFCHLFPNSYVTLLDNIAEESAAEIEQEHFGITHEELGLMCANLWGLPTEIATVIGEHHGTEESPVQSPLGIIIEAANFLDGSRSAGEEFRNPESELPAVGNPLIARRDPKVLKPLLQIAWCDFQAIAKAV